ncbi:MAG: hypothetical protein FWB91_04070 [Defluviitaleaceae bacterium]|nr:hypothetical protein [Defluviitaleaceae bacterium]
MLIDAITTASAILLRDNIAELGSEDYEMCRDIVFEYLHQVEKQGLSTTLTDMGQLDATMSCITILPLFLNKALHEDMDVIHDKILFYMLHADHKIRESIAKGIFLFTCKYAPEHAEKYLGIAINLSGEIDGLINEARKNEEGVVLWTAPIKADIYKNETDLFLEKIPNVNLHEHIRNINFENSEATQVRIALIIASKYQSDLSKTFVKKVLGLMDISETHDERSERRFDYQEVNNYAVIYADIISNDSGDAILDLTDELRKIGLEAPQFTKNLLVYLEHRCYTAGKEDLFWQVWNIIATPIADAIKNKCLNGNSHRISELIGKLLYLDSPWQKKDYELQSLERGKPMMLQFIKATIEDLVTFESLVRLTYHFPSIFFIEGLLVLSSVDKTVLKDLIADASDNTRFCLDNVLHKYLVFETPVQINKMYYETCEKLLNNLIDNGSTVAYNSREVLIKSKRKAL